MRVRLVYVGLGVLLAVLVFFASCEGSRADVIRYCDPANRGAILNEPADAMTIDLKRSLIYGSDTSFSIYPISDGGFVGFDSAFPLLIFDRSVEPDLLEGEVVVNDIRFRITSVEGSFGDLWIISTQPDKEPSDDPSEYSAVLYSLEDGVLVIGGPAFIGDDVFAVNFVPCGNRTLRYEDVRALVESRGGSL